MESECHCSLFGRWFARGLKTKTTTRNRRNRHSHHDKLFELRILRIPLKALKVVDPPADEIPSLVPDGIMKSTPFDI